MLAAIIIICSVASTPDLQDCTPDNARAVMRRARPEFANPTFCFMHGQAYLAETLIGQKLDDGNKIENRLQAKRGRPQHYPPATYSAFVSARAEWAHRVPRSVRLIASWRSSRKCPTAVSLQTHPANRCDRPCPAGRDCYPRSSRSAQLSRPSHTAPSLFVCSVWPCGLGGHLSQMLANSLRQIGGSGGGRYRRLSSQAQGSRALGRT